MNVHIEGHINWTNSTADFLTTGTVTATGITAGVTGVLSPDYTLNFDTQNYLITDRAETYLAIQGQLTGTQAGIDLFTYDGDGTDNNNITIWAKGVPSDVTDREYLQVGYLASGPNMQIVSGAAGTGTVRPLYLYTGANTTQLVLGVDGSVDMAGSLGVTGSVTTARLLCGGVQA